MTCLIWRLKIRVWALQRHTSKLHRIKRINVSCGPGEKLINQRVTENKLIWHAVHHRVRREITLKDLVFSWTSAHVRFVNQSPPQTELFLLFLCIISYFIHFYKHYSISISEGEAGLIYLTGWIVLLKWFSHSVRLLHRHCVNNSNKNIFLLTDNQTFEY